jgi:hypothetical protein
MMAPRPAVGRAVIALAAVGIIVIVAISYLSTTIQSGGPGTLENKASSTKATLSPTNSTSTTQSTTQSTAQSTIQSTAQSTCSAGRTVTVSIGQSGPPCGCELVDSNASGSLYVSPNAKVGDNVCVEASLKNTSEVSLTITNSSGSVVFSAICVATGGAGPATGDTCTAFWNTANPDPQGNAITAGTYHLVSGDLEANFTLS